MGQQHLCICCSRRYLEILKWARENGCEWDFHTGEAAQYGHLEVIKRARDNGNGRVWDNRICNNAAKGGQLEVLKWAKENDCLWDDYTCEIDSYFQVESAINIK
jgi:hypothetical protein